jgi:hypothetical protein
MRVRIFLAGVVGFTVQRLSCQDCDCGTSRHIGFPYSLHEFVLHVRQEIASLPIKGLGCIFDLDCVTSICYQFDERAGDDFAG